GIESIGKLVAEGLGISVLPDWNVGGPPDFAIKRWALPPPHMEREVGIVWTRAGVRAQLAQTLVALAAPLFKLESVTGPSRWWTVVTGYRRLPALLGNDDCCAQAARCGDSLFNRAAALRAASGRPSRRLSVMGVCQCSRALACW